MSSYYLGFDVLEMDADGNAVPMPETELEIFNVATSASLGSVESDANGIVPTAQLNVNAGTKIGFEYKGGAIFYRTTRATTAELFEQTLSFIAENALNLATVTAVLAEVWVKDLTNDTEPQLLGTFLPGQTHNIPFPIEKDKDLRFYCVSVGRDGRKSALNLTEAHQQFVEIRLEPTPTIGQLSAATNTTVSIGVNGFRTQATHRKVQVSSNSNMSSATEEILLATEFSGNVFPESVTIVKPSSTNAETKYIRVAHSSNGVNYSAWSNVLTVTFANSGGSGGSGGGWGGTCFSGETRINIGRSLCLSIESMFENKQDIIGKQTLSFDHNKNIVKDTIVDVFRHEVFSILEILFSDNSELRVTPEHRFLTPDDFVAIGYLTAEDEVFKIIDGKLQPIKIKSIRSVEVPGGMWVYNLTTQNTHHYFAKGFAVHNAKQVEI